MWNGASTYDDAIDIIPGVGLSCDPGRRTSCPRLGLRVLPNQACLFLCFADRAHIRQQSHSRVKR
jgi:hypothetical protein